MWNSRTDIHLYYLQQARAVVCPTDRVLKTDGWNEAEANPMFGGIAGNITCKSVTLLELSSHTALLAKKNVPSVTVTEGDIRHVPFAMHSFDVVLDLSTLDHVPFRDVNAVLGQYWKVLDLKGTLLLFVWCGTTPAHPVERGKDIQYYFPQDDLTLMLARLFEIRETENTVGNGVGGVLVKYLCWRR